MNFFGWLINVSIKERNAELVFKTDEGRIAACDAYNPYFYAICKEPEEACHVISNHPLVECAILERKFSSIESEREEQVVKVVVGRVGDFQSAAKDVSTIPGVKEICELSIPHSFKYVMDRKLCFFKKCEIELKGGELARVRELDSEELPELSLSTAIANSGSIELRNHGFGKGEADVVFSYGMDGRFGRRVESGNSIHIDVEEDMMHDIYSEGEVGEISHEELLAVGKERLVRIMELSRLSKVKPESICRITPGRINTFLHMNEARKRNIIIPDLKKFIERPKTFNELRRIDKGGTIFYPEVGIFKNVAKCDFSSMYPNIIVKYNISSECMNRCFRDCKLKENCKNYFSVPGTFWRICMERKGVIPEGIREVLDRRLELKKMMKNEKNLERRHVLDLQQRALKNILVTCFGYLGFSNFVFSNVECKECVMLLGREIILEAKSIAEERNLKVLYGIVDSLFLGNGSAREYGEFAEEASEKTGIGLELDCVFRRIAFPSSKEGAGIASKYYGITYEGELEARGIAIRHSDACSLIKNFQLEAIPIILGENEFEENLKKARAILEKHKNRMRKKEASLEEFAITKPLHKSVEEYKVNAPHVVAYRKSAGAETPNNKKNIVRFVYSKEGPIPAEEATIENLDEGKYGELLERSLEELVRGIN